MAAQSPAGHEPYYVPAQSKLALATAFSLFLGVVGAGSVMNTMTFGKVASDRGWMLFGLGVLFFITSLFVWFRATIIENRRGLAGVQVRHSFALGMQWFIFSEVMFFSAFFGALFYVRNLAGPWLAGMGDGLNNTMIWPGFEYSWPLMETPQQAVGGAGNQPLANTGEFSGPGQNLSFPGWGNLLGWLPLWNTIVLISSSFTVHLAHLGLKQNNRRKLNLWLFTSVALAAIFIVLQITEYRHAYGELGLTLGSGIYGSTFFMLTGFHGFHVMIGATMLLVQWLRASTVQHFTAEDHFGFEASAWYWHFVDVVWVALFLFVYVL